MNFLGSALNSIKPRDDDTIFDRVNYYYSTIIIVFAAAVLTAKQYVGQPIQCFVPAEFSRAWEQYAEDYWRVLISLALLITLFSFVYNTYWVKPGEKVPDDLNEREERQLIYYQWVPFLLALEAGFFYLPVIFWAQMNTKSGLNIANMVKIVQKCDDTEGAERNKAVETICRYMEDSVRLQKVRRDVSSATEKHLTLGLLHGTYLANMYILTKLLYLFNVIGQFVMMNQFLGQNNSLWGINILNDIRTGRDWELSGNFPRIAMCDFSVRILAHIQRFSVQCVLVVNMFNEKVFLFLYIWFIIVFGLTFFDMWRWTYMTKISGRRVAYIERFLKPNSDEHLLFREFCDKIINADGIIVLKMIAGHSNELFSQQILHTLWDKFKSSVELNQVIIADKVPRSEDSSSLGSTDKKLRVFERTLSIMGARVKLPLLKTDQNGDVFNESIINQVATTNPSGHSTPMFYVDDKSETPLIRQNS